MKTPRVYVTIRVDAPMAAKLSKYNRTWIINQFHQLICKALESEINVDVGEDLESLDFGKPKVTVRRSSRKPS